MDRALFISRGLAFKAFQEFVLTVGPVIVEGARWLDEHPWRPVLSRLTSR